MSYLHRTVRNDQEPTSQRPPRWHLTFPQTACALSRCPARSSPSGALTGQLLASYSSSKGGWLGDLLVTTGGLAEATISKAYTPPPIDLAGPDGRDGQRQGGGNGSGSSNKLVLGTFRFGGVVALPASTTAAPPLPKVRALCQSW